MKSKKHYLTMLAVHLRLDSLSEIHFGEVHEKAKQLLELRAAFMYVYVYHSPFFCTQ